MLASRYDVYSGGCRRFLGLSLYSVLVVGLVRGATGVPVGTVALLAAVVKAGAVIGRRKMVEIARAVDPGQTVMVCRVLAAAVTPAPGGFAESKRVRVGSATPK